MPKTMLQKKFCGEDERARIPVLKNTAHAPTAKHQLQKAKKSFAQRNCAKRELYNKNQRVEQNRKGGKIV